MADNKRVQITVVADDSQAHEALDGLIEKLERIAALTNLSITGDASGTAAGSGDGGAGAVGKNTSSTAGGSGGGGSDSGGGGGGGADFRHSMGYRVPAAAGAVAAGAGSVIQSMATDPGAAFTALGGVLNKSVNVMTDAAAAMAENMPNFTDSVPILGSMLGGALKMGAMAGAAYLGLVGAGMNIRMGKITELASLERPAEIANVSGFGGAGDVTGAAQQEAKFYGFGAQEAAQIAAQYARARGGPSGGSFNDVYRLAASGISPELVARIAGLGTQGGGAVEGVSGAQSQALRMISVAQNSGLSGSKVDEFLGRIAASTSQLAEEGLYLDLSDTSNFMETMRQVGERVREEEDLAANPFGGMQGPRAAAKLQSGAMGALQRLKAPLQGLSEMVLLSDAFANADQYGGGLLGGISRLEHVAQSPAGVHQVIQGQLGGNQELARMVFTGMGFSQPQAELLARKPGGTAGEVTGFGGSAGGASTDAFSYSSRLGDAERQLLSEVAKLGVASNENLISVTSSIQQFLVNQSSKMDDLMDGLNEMIQIVLN